MDVPLGNIVKMLGTQVALQDSFINTKVGTKVLRELTQQNVRWAELYFRNQRLRSAYYSLGAMAPYTRRAVISYIVELLGLQLGSAVKNPLSFAFRKSLKVRMLKLLKEKRQPGPVLSQVSNHSIRPLGPLEDLLVDSGDEADDNARNALIEPGET